MKMETQCRERQKNREYEQGKEENMRLEIYASHQVLCVHVIINLVKFVCVCVYVCRGVAQVFADSASIYVYLPAYWIIIWLSRVCVSGK